MTIARGGDRGARAHRGAAASGRARALALAAAFVLLLLTGCVTQGSPDQPTETAATPATTQAPGEQTAFQGSPVLKLDAVSPAVVRPGQSATVNGQVVAAAGSTISNPTLRAIRSRQPMLTRSDVESWASGTATPNGTEIARQSLPVTLTPGQSGGFSLVLGAADLAMTRSYGAVPIAVEVLGDNGRVLGSVRTFVGWQRMVDYEPISLTWVVPLTLDPDPDLSSAVAATRTAAWQRALGPDSRLSRLVRATSGADVAWALDPAVLGRDTRTAAQVAADPVTPVIAPFEEQLRQGATSSPSRQRSVLALPYADADLAAVPDGALVKNLVSRGMSLGSQLGVPVQTGVAWPADGAVPRGREAALRDAYSGGLSAILASSDLTETGRSLTPPAPAVGTLKTPVLRWDDRLSTLAAHTTASDSSALVTQQFVAQVAMLLGERPGTPRTFLVAAPRGLDPDPGSLSRLLSVSEDLPWVKTLDVMQAVSEAAKAGRPTIDELSPPASAQPAVLTPAMAASLEQQNAVIDTMSHTLADSAGYAVQWQDTVDQLTSVRWRANPSGHAELLQRVYAATSAVSHGLSITEQTTNFLADEGLLRVTIVNDLDAAVDGIQLTLAPTNPRLRVVSTADPVRIEAHSKATVQVRVEAVAAGIVPVNASLTTSDGIPIGEPATLTVRAAPPGNWLYLVFGTLVGLVLVVGVVRGLRRPRTASDQLSELDLVTPARELPLQKVVRTGPAAADPPDGSDGRE